MSVAIWSVGALSADQGGLAAARAYGITSGLDFGIVDADATGGEIISLDLSYFSNP